MPLNEASAAVPGDAGVSRRGDVEERWALRLRRLGLCRSSRPPRSFQCLHLRRWGSRVLIGEGFCPSCFSLPPLVARSLESLCMINLVSYGKFPAHILKHFHDRHILIYLLHPQRDPPLSFLPFIHIIFLNIFLFRELDDECLVFSLLNFARLLANSGLNTLTNFFCFIPWYWP